jgi:hypothetical protein
VLRGVILQDNNKLWQQILSSIGKALLNENSIPKPVLAGANVMAGRVAEACPPPSRENLSAASAALKRAQEIKDKRWILLLQQDFDPLQIAQGYYTRAALIQSDTPPMWKKVWDLWSSRCQDNDPTPFEAQTAIQNLIRIMSAKGNRKRVAELQLRLIQSYFNNNIRTSQGGISNLW